MHNKDVVLSDISAERVLLALVLELLVELGVRHLQRYYIIYLIFLVREKENCQWQLSNINVYNFNQSLYHIIGLQLNPLLDTYICNQLNHLYFRSTVGIIN